MLIGNFHKFISMKTRILVYSRVYDKNRETCKLYFQHSTTGSIGENNLLANILGQHTFAPAFTRNLWHYKSCYAVQVEGEEVMLQ